jgi:hypothetical protein
MAMSNMRNGILGLIAVSATFGAVQLAFGHDLASGLRSFSAVPAEAVNRAAVNRAVKGDRAVGLAATLAPTQTISIHVDRLNDTSVLVRIPRAADAGKPSAAPTLIKSQDQKAAVACDSTVSVLTDVAKRLQPGRCVT